MPTACRDVQEGVPHYWESISLPFEGDRASLVPLPWARGGAHSAVPAGSSGTPVTAEEGGRAEAPAPELRCIKQHKASRGYTSHPRTAAAAPPCATVSLYGSSEMPLTWLEFVRVLTDQESGLRSHWDSHACDARESCCASTRLLCDTLIRCEPLYQVSHS